MSYESKMLKDLAMPTRKEVERALLVSLLKHGGVIKEFGSGEEIVDEIARSFRLTKQQRGAFLETIYRKQNRVKKAFLWHRLLFRAADSLARNELVSRPSQTVYLINKREWMLTEKGFDEALKLSNIPIPQKESLPTKSYEVQRIVKKLREAKRPHDYNPFDNSRNFARVTREVRLRTRGFRQAVVEAYDYKCSVCGLKLCSPDALLWEVEAAHIVPYRSRGRDDIWNGLALCRLHHWAFDVGWFTLREDYSIEVSSQIHSLPTGFGLLGGFEFARTMTKTNSKIILPAKVEIYPHVNSISWHRQNIFLNQGRI